MDCERTMKAYLFPGQGSQRVGMGQDLFDAFPDLVAAADRVLGYSIRDLCLKDVQRQLSQTQYTQPALYVVNALTWRQRRKSNAALPDFVAGHSLGEYNALECAGAFSFEDGLQLVQRRGELMATAPKGAMAAIIGVGADKVAEILASSGLTAIDVANYNAHNQTVISGLEADVRNAQAVFEKHQAMYIPLNVTSAFHSRYMQPAREEFGTFLRGFTFAAPKIPVIANTNALPYQDGDVAKNLGEQLAQSVRWVDSMEYLLRQGVADFAELGPGDVLTKLIRGIRSQFKPGAELKRADDPAPSAPAPKVAPSGTAQERVADWNRRFPVGTTVRVKGYNEPLTTKTEAVILFGHRAAIYMQGYNGYFALDDVELPAKAA
jgi:malonyl CoA-acyl carrier protein transacylase